MSDFLDHLRIIARDGGRLDRADCATIAAAADEFERVQRELAVTQEKLIEANFKRIALAERIIDLNDKVIAQKQSQLDADRAARARSMSMSSGWVT